jgi:hemoglobin-like flavoprotein
MRDRDIKLVQETFNKVAHVENFAAKILYNRLFELDPKLMPLFPQDMNEMEEKFIKTLGLIVLGLARIYEVTPFLEDLARRHKDYGVKYEDYDTLGDALIYTLQKVLGEEFTPEVKAAWVHAYTIIARIMRNAQRKAA